MSRTSSDAATVMVQADPAADPVRPAPICRWAGGKRRLTPQLLPHFPKHFSTYIEPFAGGAAVFFHLRASGFTGLAYLSDVNAPLMMLYQELRDQPDRLISLYEALIRDYEAAANKEGWFYAAREHWLDEQPDLVRAARFLILNNLSHAGLFRLTPSTGGFNVPFDLSLITGKGRKPPYKSRAELMAASQALQNTVLEIGSFDVLLRLKMRRGPSDWTRDTLVFCDSPYSVLPGTQAFTQYQRDPFGPVQHALLRDVAQEVRDSGVSIVLTNSDTPEVQELYSSRERWALHAISASRAIDRKSGFAKEAKELIIVGRPVEAQ